jgi:hypothetical protein
MSNQANSAGPTHLVIVSTADGDRSFTVNGLSGEEVRQLLSRAAEGKFFKVIELDTHTAKGKALDHLVDATGAMAILFVLSALVIRRLQRWLQQ